MKIYTYTSEITNIEEELKLSVWVRSWRDRGWTPEILTNRQAQLHPLWNRLDTLGRLESAADRLSWGRWLAFAQMGGGWLAEPEVISHSFTPRPAPYPLTCCSRLPDLSLVGCSGATAEQFAEVLFRIPPGPSPQLVLELLKAKVEFLLQAPGDPACLKFGESGWETAPAVHYGQDGSPNSAGAAWLKSAMQKWQGERVSVSNDRPRVLISVLGDSTSQATFDRHLPYWERLGFPMLVACPTNGMVHTNHDIFAFGRSEHHGRQNVGRLRALLCHLSHTDFDWHLVLEYDALLIAQRIPEVFPAQPGFWANWFFDGDPRRPFIGGSYAHVPWLIDRSTLKRLIDTMDGIPTVEDGFPDRFAGMIAERAGVKPRRYMFRGYSQNTIDTQFLPGAVSAVKDGAIFVHGIKNQQVLQSILAAPALDRASPDN